MRRRERRRRRQSDLAGVRILLAEDGFDNQQLIKTLLGRAGAEVEIAENGRVAVEKAGAGRFDVILMDMNMPEMDGYEATRTLRDRGYQGPILALTANAMSDDAQRSLDAGCNDHLTKPIDRARLTAAIAHYAGRLAATPPPGNSHAMAAAVPPPDPTSLAIDEPLADDTGPIVSQFADDPEMVAILDGFVFGLDRSGGRDVRRGDGRPLRRLAARGPSDEGLGRELRISPIDRGRQDAGRRRQGGRCPGGDFSVGPRGHTVPSH